MPKEFKPGWEYIHSDTLRQEVAVNIKTGEVYCEDRTIYSPKEIKIMNDAKQEITPGVHRVKMIFGGEIVSFKENGRNDQGAKSKGETNGPGTLPGQAHIP
jgi:hypothetical protein